MKDGLLMVEAQRRRRGVVVRNWKEDGVVFGMVSDDVWTGMDWIGRID